MLTTKSGMYGFCEPLASLEETFQNEAIIGKIRTLQKTYPSWRRCRGDGDCYYRAVGFGILEEWLQHGATDKVDRFRRLIQGLPAAFPQAQCTESVAFLEAFFRQGGAGLLQRFYELFLVDPAADRALVWVLRFAVADYLTRQRAVETTSGMTFEALVQAIHDQDIDTYLQAEILKSNTEAESVVQLVLPTALDLRVLLVQLDKNGTDLQWVRFPEDLQGRPDVVALFKPGHYDLLYDTKLGDSVLACEMGCDLKGSCEQPPECPICLETIQGDRVELPCGHVYCQLCATESVSFQRGQGAADIVCNICHARIPDDFLAAMAMGSDDAGGRPGSGAGPAGRQDPGLSETSIAI